MSQEEFDRLLRWLGPDRDSSAKKYLESHERLTRLFYLRGCSRPEDLADEVMDRVAKKPPPLEPSLDQIAVLLGYARNVLHEYWRQAPFGEDREPSEEPCMDETVLKETLSRCLDGCRDRLPEDDRHLLLQYHGYEPGGKIAHRQAMAKERQTTLNALRLKVCRLTSVVGECVKRCCESGSITGVQ